VHLPEIRTTSISGFRREQSVYLGEHARAFMANSPGRTGKLQIQEDTLRTNGMKQIASGAWNILFIAMENACLPLPPYLIFRYRKNGSNSLAGLARQPFIESITNNSSLLQPHICKSLLRFLLQDKPGRNHMVSRGQGHNFGITNPSYNTFNIA